LNSFNFSVVNCDVDDGLFSTSILPLSRFSIFESEFADVILGSLEDVDDDTDGGLGSRKKGEIYFCYFIFSYLHVKYGS
jgi:hypothetical protein